MEKVTKKTWCCAWVFSLMLFYSLVLQGHLGLLTHMMVASGYWLLQYLGLCMVTGAAKGYVMNNLLLS